MAADTRYYTIHTNGRERIQANSIGEAKNIFAKHWSRKATWIVDGERKLIMERREVLFTEKIRAR